MAFVTGQDLLNFGMQFLGEQYVWGGQAPGGFDCSGLMWYIAKNFGLSIPRTSNAQIAALQSVPLSQAQPGDLVFFDSDNNGMSDHVGMYAGNGEVLVADNPSVPIHIVSVSTEARITGVGRIPGVVVGQGDSSLSGSTLSGLESSLGFGSGAAIPAVRPTFDLWGSLGLQAPNSAQLNENYGLAASFLESDPELANLYSQAVANTWSTDQFQAALQQTQWWQTNSASARQLLAEKATDPAKYQQDLNQKMALVQQQATALGVHLSQQSLQNVSSVSMLLSYNDAQINGMLSKYLQLSQDGHFSGYAGQVELGLREYARDMGIPLSDEYVSNAVQSIVAGTDTLQARRAVIQTMAQGAFPAYAQQINDGTTVGQIAAPYLAAQAKLWEVDPNKIDLFDNTLRGVLQQKDQGGNPVQVPLYTFETQLRQNPKWLQTNNAREGLLAGANQVLSDLGMISPTVGAAPQTSLSVTQNLRANYGGLSGATDFPTLQGQSYQNPPSAPTGAGVSASSSDSQGISSDASALAPDTSFQVGTTGGL